MRIFLGIVFTLIGLEGIFELMIGSMRDKSMSILVLFFLGLGVYLLQSGIKNRNDLQAEEKRKKQEEDQKNAAIKEIKLASDKFYALRPSYKNNIETLNEVIRLGEHLLKITPRIDASPIATSLISPYDERARYYRRHAKQPGNVENSISDYNRIIELIPIASNGKSNNSDEFHLRSAYEGRCECYMENEMMSNAINAANQVINKYQDSKAYILRSKCYFVAEVFDLAETDIVHALKIIQNQIDLSNAIELQKNIREKTKVGQILSNQINIHGNVSGSTIIAGNENSVRNSEKYE